MRWPAPRATTRSRSARCRPSRRARHWRCCTATTPAIASARRLGETVGAQIVSVPFEVQTRRANAAFKDFLIALAGAFALLFVALNVLLSRMVLGPLNLANAALDRLADTDALTGAHNRRSFDRRLQEAISAARRGKRPLSLIALDIDHFKQINDRFGHETGDDVLKQACAA